MSKLIKTSLCAGAALAMSATASASDDQSAAVKSTIDAATAAWLKCDVDAAAKYDVDGRTSYYPDSATLMIEDAKMIQDERDFCKNGGKNELTYSIAGVEVMGETAYAYGTGHYKRTEPGGAVSIDNDYTFTDILVKTSDGWKYKHSHVGAVMPMSEAAPATQ